MHQHALQTPADLVGRDGELHGPRLQLRMVLSYIGIDHRIQHLEADDVIAVRIMGAQLHPIGSRPARTPGSVLPVGLSHHIRVAQAPLRQLLLDLQEQLPQLLGILSAEALEKRCILLRCRIKERAVNLVRTPRVEGPDTVEDPVVAVADEENQGTGGGHCQKIPADLPSGEVSRPHFSGAHLSGTSRRSLLCRLSCRPPGASHLHDIGQQDGRRENHQGNPELLMMRGAQDHHAGGRQQIPPLPPGKIPVQEQQEKDVERNPEALRHDALEIG